MARAIASSVQSRPAARRAVASSILSKTGVNRSATPSAPMAASWSRSSLVNSAAAAAAVLARFKLSRTVVRVAITPSTDATHAASHPIGNRRSVDTDHARRNTGHVSRWEACGPIVDPPPGCFARRLGNPRAPAAFAELMDRLLARQAEMDLWEPAEPRSAGTSGVCSAAGRRRRRLGDAGCRCTRPTRGVRPWTARRTRCGGLPP